MCLLIPELGQQQAAAGVDEAARVGRGLVVAAGRSVDWASRSSAQRDVRRKAWGSMSGADGDGGCGSTGGGRIGGAEEGGQWVRHVGQLERHLRDQVARIGEDGA